LKPVLYNRDRPIFCPPEAPARPKPGAGGSAFGEEVSITICPHAGIDKSVVVALTLAYMAIVTKTRIQKIEREIQEIWKVLGEDIFWHPTVIKEIQQRSRAARKLFGSGKLRMSGEVFSGR